MLEKNESIEVRVTVINECVPLVQISLFILQINLKDVIVNRKIEVITPPYYMIFSCYCTLRYNMMTELAILTRITNLLPCIFSTWCYM